MIVRNAHVHRLHARPGRRAGFAAVGTQHVGRERRLVCGSCTAWYRAKLACHPALVRQRALEILADHPLNECGPGEQFVEGGTLDVVQRGGGVGCGGQREGQEEMKTVSVHDAAHCMANDGGLSIPGADR